MLIQGIRSDTTIRRAIDAALSGEEYRRSLQEVILAAIAAMIESIRAALSRAAREHPAIFWTSVTVLAIILILVFARGAWLAKRRAALLASAARLASGGGGEASSDPWRTAQQLAAKGSFTEAAHALYRHLLHWLALSEKLDLHPAKTVGDYARELRTRSSRAHAGYREFARTYEVVIYGAGVCDRERYDRLLSLANAITVRNG